MTKIRTVTGDIDPETTGITLTHEHILYADDGASFDPRAAFDIDKVSDSISETLKMGMADHGIRTVVDMTANEVGRHPHLVREVAKKSGAQIISITGFYPEVLGLPYHWRAQPVDAIRDLFITDITEGTTFAYQQTDVKAGAIKIATGSGGYKGTPSPTGPSGTHMTALEEKVVRAAGRAQARLGCCVNTHTEAADYSFRNPGLEQLDVLEAEGADPTKVIIGHALINPTMSQLLDICKRGASLQIDHIGIPWMNPSADYLDEKMANAICELAEAGHLDRMVFSYDRFFYMVHTVMDEEEEQEMLNDRLGLGYMFDSFIPRLSKKGFTEQELHAVLVENPRRLFAF